MDKRFHKSCSGASLLQVLVAVGVMGIVGTVMSTMLTNSGKNQKHIELRDELLGVKQTLRGGISCTDVLASGAIKAANVKSTCKSTAAAGGQSGPFLKLVKKTGSGKVKDLGTWDSALNASMMGDWAVRVSCSEAEESLIVRVAKPAKGGSGKFAKDPLTGKAMDFDAPGALLFGSGSDLLCSSSIAGLGTPKSNAGGCSANTAGVACGDVKVLSGTGCAFIPGWDTITKKMVGTAMCPGDEMAVGGGGTCGSTTYVGILKTQGMLVANHPTADGRGWQIECCVFAINNQFTSTLPGGAYAICRPPPTE